MPTSSQNPTPDPMPDDRFAEIAARAEAAYPGPWRWYGNTEVRHLRLSSPHGGGMTVMDFARYGMNGAQPRFAIDGFMHKAEELVEYEVAAWSKDIYRKDVSGIDHPDARFIAHAREDVPALLAEVTRLRTQVRFLLEQVRRKDAASGEGNRALAEFLAEHDAQTGGEGFPLRGGHDNPCAYAAGMGPTCTCPKRDGGESGE